MHTHRRSFSSAGCPRKASTKVLQERLPENPHQVCLDATAIPVPASPDSMLVDSTYR